MAQSVGGFYSGRSGGMARCWGKNLKIDGTWLSEADGNYTRMVSRSALEWEVLV
ncbi:MAG: hypothetical protein WCO86_06165 [Planctomycetota bacterium]